MKDIQVARIAENLRTQDLMTKRQSFCKVSGSRIDRVHSFAAGNQGSQLTCLTNADWSLVYKKLSSQLSFLNIFSSSKSESLISRILSYFQTAKISLSLKNPIFENFWGQSACTDQPENKYTKIRNLGFFCKLKEVLACLNIFSRFLLSFGGDSQEKERAGPFLSPKIPVIESAIFKMAVERAVTFDAIVMSYSRIKVLIRSIQLFVGRPFQFCDSISSLTCYSLLKSSTLVSVHLYIAVCVLQNKQDYLLLLSTACFVFYVLTNLC